MTQAYGTFPNGGTFREARTFTKVVDPEGKVILDNAQESHTAIGEKADSISTICAECRAGRYRLRRGHGQHRRSR